MDPIALISAVDLEMEPLLRRLEAPRSSSIRTRSVVHGTLEGQQVLAIAGGMGKTNAAHSLTLLLEHYTVRGIVGLGVAGAYPGSGLEPGDVAIADAQNYADEGVETPYGWISCEDIGIPLLERDGMRYFNALPVDPTRSAAAVEAATRAGLRAAAGPFVTVSSCSGTAARGAELAVRYAAVCETMEGASYAHVAATYGLPYVEIRGISNLVEDRDLSRWRFEEAAEAAAEAVSAAIRAWR